MYSNLIMYSFSSRRVGQKEKGLPQLHLCSGRTTVCTGAVPVQTEMLKKNMLLEPAALITLGDFYCGNNLSILSHRYVKRASTRLAFYVVGYLGDLK